MEVMNCGRWIPSVHCYSILASFSRKKHLITKLNQRNVLSRCLRFDESSHSSHKQEDWDIRSCFPHDKYIFGKQLLYFPLFVIQIKVLETFSRKHFSTKKKILIIFLKNDIFFFSNGKSLFELVSLGVSTLYIYLFDYYCNWLMNHILDMKII